MALTLDRGMRQFPGAALARARRAAGLTQLQLARRIGFSRPTLAGVEAGHDAGSEDLWLRCDDALGAAGDLFKLRVSSADRQSLGKPQGDDLDGYTYPSSWQEGIGLVTALWDRDLSRRSVVEAALSSGVLATAALRWSLRESEPVDKRGRVLVTDEAVMQVRGMTTELRQLDNRVGGGSSRPAVLGVLVHRVAPLLKEGDYRGSLGKGLLAATAELVQLLAWATHDDGRHELAQQYLVQALRLAQAAGDVPLGAEILAAMSHQASFVQRADIAVDLGRASARAAVDAGVSALRAEALLMEAHGHAVAGDERASLGRLDEARTTFVVAEREALPAWMGYFDEAYYAAKSAHCLTALGRLDEAERQAERSLDMNNGYLRGRAFNLALLALIAARRGNVERAVQVGGQSAELRSMVDSRRLDAYLRRVRQALEPWATDRVALPFLRATASLASS